jgi:N-acetylmuramoyl-L-alanine amidase
MSQARAAVGWSGILVAATACGGQGRRAAQLGPLTPEVVRGALEIRVSYPREGTRSFVGDRWMITADSTARIQARDSSFIFGSVGRGDARLWVNGASVAVYPTGGWLAWLALPPPPDTTASFDILAIAGSDTARATFTVALDRRYAPPDVAVWVDTTSMHPTGALWMMPDEELRLAVRAAPGAALRLVTGVGEVAFVADVRADAAPWGELAFGTARPSAARQPAMSRYTAAWRGPLGPDPGQPFGRLATPDAPDPAWPWLEASRGADTVRVRWPLQAATLDPARLPVVRVDDDTASTGRTDSVLPGRPVPYGVYHWFFPTGTIAAVSGRWNDQVRLRLSRASVAWVDAADVQPIDALPPRGAAGSLRLFADSGHLTLRIPLPARIPFAVEESHHELRVRLYGVAGDMDWIQYGPEDPLVTLVTFSQPAEDETVLSVRLAEPVWGYRTSWVGNDLHFAVRRPPAIDRRRPLAGRRIALDAGHPPAGSVGPTFVREPDVTLAVSRKARQLLERAGATVIMIRDQDQPLGLPERTMAAEREDAEVLVSIHANALPDGVNPFINNGTSVYYFHPRAAPLARAVNRALVRQLGFRDLGVGRGDLALARPTWMPAVLVEGLFIMLPDQEAVLASEDGQWRYARGIVEGLEAFLVERAQAAGR